MLALLATFGTPLAGLAAPLESDNSGAGKLEQARVLVAERQAVRQSSGDGSREPEPTTSVSGTAVKLFSALGLALAAFFIGVHLHRRMTGATAPVRSRRLKVVERLPIGAKTALVLVEIDGRPIVLTIGSDRVTALESPSMELADVERLCRDETALVAVGS
jgi:flagellar biogenesis protein FliO